MQSCQRADLAVLNEAIDAIERMKPDMFDEPGAHEACAECAKMLRSMRCRKYEHMVDWAAIAKGSV